MNQAPDAEREPSPYIRLPWPLVAGGILVFLALALAAGLFANRNLRPQVGAVPTPVAAPPTATSTPVAALAQGSTPTALVPVAPATATAALPTSVPPTSTPLPVATPRPTVTPELAAELSDAYQRYWQVRAEALYDLDTSRLQEVMAGDHLAAVEDRITELRAEGHAIETEVDHKYVIIEASPDNAKVADIYVDRSVYVDLQTRAPLSSPTDQTLSELYTFTKIDGTWRVVGLVRSS